MHNIVEKHFSISIAPVRSRGGKLVIHNEIICIINNTLPFIPEKTAKVSQKTSYRHTYHSRFIPEGISNIPPRRPRFTKIAHRRLIAVYLRCKNKHLIKAMTNTGKFIAV
jgi:hypothetical protein